MFALASIIAVVFRSPGGALILPLKSRMSPFLPPLDPEEVLRGHRGRFIAHRRAREHVVRVIYEYDGVLPVTITVYHPVAQRYFKGGETYEDRILA
jgi:hypothetical protein